MRIRKLCLGLVLAGLLGVGSQVFALIGTIDDVPAATLLLPYFEVDIANKNGVTTLFSINNAAATAVLAHVTVWTDQSVPALNFDVYLTGYDVQTINLQDLFVNGNLPRTASFGQDSFDTFSPKGLLSEDIDFPSCTNKLPYPPSAVSVLFRNHLQAWLQGNESPATHNCAGSKQPDTNILRGYVTVDTVDACNPFFPSDWAFYAPFVTHQNVLWGDYFYVYPDPVTGNHAQSETLVHIESCPTCFLPHTFYGRYKAASADKDSREPLPTTLIARFLNGGPFSGHTDFLVWREADESDSAYNCNNPGQPTWYPLEAAQILIFDEEEHPVVVEACHIGDPTCEQEILIPNEANRIDIEAELMSPYDFGWILLNLQQVEVIPIYGDDDAQAWVTVVIEAEGRFSVGHDAIQSDNANRPFSTIPFP
ncbi:MAG: hypothetical protein QOH06_3324 [Acidobacteriota bacterium]|jgi:hypothetical protein|nr:hypothetical protein [Acidobacteriota bacterium]